MTATNDDIMAAIVALTTRVSKIEDTLGVGEGFSDSGYYGDAYYGEGSSHSLYQQVVDLYDYIKTNLPPAVSGVGAYKISNIVKDSDGVAVEGAIVKAYYSGQEVVIRQGSTDVSGSFTFFFTNNNEIDIFIEAENFYGKWIRGIVPQLS